MWKEAIIFSVDAGSSMDDRFIDSDSSRFKIALECVKLTLQQKIFNNSTHELGLAVFGQNDVDSDDGNNTFLKPLAKPNLDFVRKVVELSDITLGNDKTGGDIFSAIEFIADRLVEHCGSKKYNKRGFLFTNGRGKTKYNESHFKRIVSTIKNNDVKLNIIPMDFMETYDLDSNEIDDEIFAHATQAQNSELLMKLRSMCPSHIQIFPASIAIELYKKFRKRDTNPVSLFKGRLEIAPKISIEVSTYKAVRKQRLKSLSKFDLTIPFDSEIKKQKQIESDINYIDGDDGSVVDKAYVMNAYQYGVNAVPMNEMIENATKIFEEKNFTLLGFVESEKIPRHCFLGEMDIVVPNKENHTSAKLFSAFIYSMLKEKKYGLARYIPRNSKRGVTPRLVVLIPYRSPEREMFYLTELPTVECVREYPFNGLKASTSEQKELVRKLVDKMMLFHEQPDGREVEQTKIDNMFNPYRQYFYQTLFYRALNDQSKKNEIPELDPVIRKYITPEERIYEETKQDVNKIKKEFSLKVHELSKDKLKAKKVLVWKDILEGDLSQSTMAEEPMSDILPGDIGKKFTLDNQDEERFNPAEPVISFRKMVNYHKKDLVADALNQLSSYIVKSNSSHRDDQNSHLVECAKEMRKACLEQKEAEFWDEWYEKARNNLTESLYHDMKVSGLGYILKSNEEVFKPISYDMKPVSLEVDDLD